MNKIRLTSINNVSLIHPSELLLPVNSITNLVNLLEDFETAHESNLLIHRLQENRRIIYNNQERNAVLIESMSKKSPYWIDFVLNVSPFVLDILHLLIETHENEIEDKLHAFLSKFEWFNSKTLEEQKEIIKSITRNIRFILRFVRISFKNEDE
jgi:hypothetical protein